jgi:hypothetical protein
MSYTPDRLVLKLTKDELDSLRSEVEAGRREHALKALDERGSAQELLRDQYAGRYPFELIQNANDAAASDGATGRRLHFILTDTALLVADQGAGFGTDQVRAICGIARSSKDPRKNIGYKGLGFKSVNEITSAPQIISPQVQFGFDGARVRALVEKIAGALASDQRLPEYALPFPITLDDLDGDRLAVTDLQRDGFRTIFRLPFKHGVSRSAVDEMLRETVRPRLLLFLDALDELRLSGTSYDFVATTCREERPGYTEVLLDCAGVVEHFLLFEADRAIEDRSLLADVGRAWNEVEQVRMFAAVPLDSDGLPRVETPEPFHVYFPTEEPSGLPLILSADFQLELDRRRMATTPNSLRYNEWLIDQMAAFLVDDVLPSITDICRRDPRVAAAFAAVGPLGKWAELLRRGVVAMLRDRAFIPCVDGRLRAPNEVRLLPLSVPDLENFHQMLPKYGYLAHAELDEDSTVRDFLKKDLNVQVIGGGQVLKDLTPSEDSKMLTYYSQLVEWSKREPRWNFEEWLRNAACVRLMDGTRRRPREALLPHQRMEIQFPAGLNAAIADLPDVCDVVELLESAGLRRFEWGHFITDTLMPVLSDATAQPDTRQSGMDLLRAYYEAGDHDKTIRKEVGKTLIQAVDASGHQRHLVAANLVYFGRDWAPKAGLAELYGGFGHSEFLAEPDGRDSDIGFFKWLGVEDKPRVFQNRSSVPAHLQSSERDFATKWWRSAEYRKASVCPDGHPNSQHLDTSPGIDRLDDLVVCNDWSRLCILWNSLAANWSHYAPAMTARYRCGNSAHGWNKPVRPFASLVALTLRTAQWVPVVHGSEHMLACPNSVWLPSDQTSKQVLKRLPLLASGLVAPAALCEELELIDVERPRSRDLIGLLRDLEAAPRDGDDGVVGVRQVAAWAMRKLDRVAASIDSENIGSIPLLAHKGGVTIFDARPYVSHDRMLKEAWGDVLPIYGGDVDLRHLIEALQLPNLDELVHAEPKWNGRDPIAEAKTAEHIDAVKPYLLAYVLDIAPSRHEEVSRALSGLKVVCAQEFFLEYRLGDERKRSWEPTTYVSGDGGSRRQRRCGTAYFELDGETGLVDWFSFGPQLASFVGVDRAGDGFAILLDGDDDARQRYLRSRRITAAEIDAARTLLAEQDNSEADDETGPVIHADPPVDLSPAESPDSDEVLVPDGPQPPFGHDAGGAPRKSVDSLDEGAGSNPVDPETACESGLDGAGGTSGMPRGNSPATEVSTDMPRRDGPREDRETSGTAESAASAPQGPQVEAAHESRRQNRFFSYVVAEDTPPANGDRQPDQVAPDVDSAGVDRVLKYERAAGRQPEEQEHGNKGYDIVSRNHDKSVARIIEVKSLSRQWAERGVTLSSSQVAENRDRGDEYWLYVVEFARDDSRANVIPIQNPISHAEYFVFDRGWEALSENVIATTLTINY